MTKRTVPLSLDDDRRRADKKGPSLTRRFRESKRARRSHGQGRFCGARFASDSPRNALIDLARAKIALPTAAPLGVICLFEQALCPGRSFGNGLSGGDGTDLLSGCLPAVSFREGFPSSDRRGILQPKSAARTGKLLRVSMRLERRLSPLEGYLGAREQSIGRFEDCSKRSEPRRIGLGYAGEARA